MTAEIPEGDEDNLDGNDTNACVCKVGRSIDKYGLGRPFNDTLRKRYTHDGESLRDLEQVLNEAIVDAALEDGRGSGRVGAGSQVDATTEEIVATLRGSDDIPSRDTARIKTQLDQAGVDVDELRRDLVSYRTVKKHLNQCLDVDTSKTETITISDASRTVQWSMARCEGVIRRTIGRLRRVDLVTVGDEFTVDVTVRVSCRGCNQPLTIMEFLENKGCHCND